MTKNDDEPTHDCYGTDLRRVRGMLAVGYEIDLIAESLGIPLHLARYAVLVATGDREGAPSEEELAAICREIQAGWTDDQAVAARRGEARLSSLVVRPDHAVQAARRQDWLARRQAERVAAGVVPVFERPSLPASQRFQARVDIQINGRRYYASQSFATREQAERWGRAWMVRKWEEAAHAEACVGK